VNYLALCKRLRSEAGLSGTGPATVVDQTGEMLRVVNWIAEAYEFIQNAYSTWRFLRTDFSFSTTASKQGYTPAEASITDHADWIEESIRLYSSITDEQFLYYLPWTDFRDVYMFGSHRTQEQRPSIVSIKPDNTLMLWQIPNAIYTCVGEYYTVPDVLAGDSGTPNFPERFHMAIVWKALMLYGAYAAADEKYAHGDNEFSTLLRQLSFDQLEKATYGAPLA
jgi:hypothetical protein